jgi:hypothetical protein
MSFSDRFVRVPGLVIPAAAAGCRGPTATREVRGAAQPGQNGREPEWLPTSTFYAWHVQKVLIFCTFARQRQTWLLLKLVPFVSSDRSASDRRFGA